MHLTKEQQIKSELIKEISLAYFKRTDKLITTEEFDFLYDKSVPDLIDFLEFYKDMDNKMKELADIARQIIDHLKGE